MEPLGHDIDDADLIVNRSDFPTGVGVVRTPRLEDGRGGKSVYLELHDIICVDGAGRNILLGTFPLLRLLVPPTDLDLLSVVDVDVLGDDVTYVAVLRGGRCVIGRWVGV